MVNAIYDTGGRQKFLEGSIAWLTDTIKAVLTTSGYTPNLETDEFLSTIAAGNRIKTSDAFTGKGSTKGIASAADLKVKRVNGTVARIVVFKSTGADATSPLLTHFDTGTGLPASAKGSDVKVKWQITNPKVFKL